jgi:hypothetical protein
MWQQQCTHLSLGTKWILHDVEPGDNGGHFGIDLEWVKETRLFCIFCESTIAYIGQTGCCIKASTTDSSILNKSAVVEHGINILLNDKGVLARKKNSHMNYIMWDMMVIGLCCDEMVTT